MEDADHKDFEWLQKQREKKGFKPGMCPTCWNSGYYRPTNFSGDETIAGELKKCPWGCLPSSTKTQ